MTPTRDVHSCLVCGVSTTITQLGLNVCRACAAFFRRISHSKRRLQCRQGKRECKLVDGPMCKLCRYERCIQLKMGEGNRSRRRTQSSITDTQLLKLSIVEKQESIIERINKEYELVSDRRKKAEDVLRTSNYDLRRLPDIDEEIYIADRQFWSGALKITAYEVVEFARKAFPEYNELSNDDQHLLFKPFLRAFAITEAYWSTYKYFSNTKHDHLMVSHTSCFEQSSMAEYVKNNTSIEMKNELIHSVEWYDKENKRVIMPVLLKAKLTETEYRSILCLGMWQLDGWSSIPENILRLSENIRKEIFNDLNRYYIEEFKLNEYSVRLGNLMSASYAMKEVISLITEQLRLNATVFNLYSSDEFMKQLANVGPNSQLT